MSKLGECLERSQRAKVLKDLVFDMVDEPEPDRFLQLTEIVFSEAVLLMNDEQI